MSIRRVHAEFVEDGEILVVFHTGEVRVFNDPAKIVTAIRRSDGAASRAAEKAGHSSLVVTQIDWTNVPEGFEVPA